MDFSEDKKELTNLETNSLPSLKQKIDDFINEIDKEHQLKLREIQMQSYSEMLDIINPNELYCMPDIKKSILYFACEFGNINIVKYLLTQRKVDINAITKIKSTGESIYLYMLNMTNGRDQSFDGFIKSTQKNYIEKTALHIAIEKGHTEIVQILLSDPKIDININLKVYNDDCLVDEKTILCIAVEKENIDIIKLLLSQPNIDINSKSKSNKLIYRSDSNNEIKEREVCSISNIGTRKEIMFNFLMKLIKY